MDFQFLRGTSGSIHPGSNPLQFRNPVIVDSRFRFNPSHPFFSVALKFTEEEQELAEYYALQSAHDSKREPIVLSFGVNEESFELLKGKVYRLKRNEDNTFDEVPITKIDDLLSLNQVLIDGSGLGNKEFEKLGLQIGTGSEEGKFEYKDAQDLGIGLEGSAPALEGVA